MQIREKFSDRRRNQRGQDSGQDTALELSLPDQNRRCKQRRRHERLNLSYEVLLPDQNGKTINVSASGIYLEVATDDMEAFTSGTTIPFQINTVATTPGFRESKLKITGRGLVIRNCIIEDSDHGNRLGVASEFRDKLNIVLDRD